MCSYIGKRLKKIKSSLKLFSEVAALFNECNFLGNSEWRYKAKKRIEKIKSLDIKKQYFSLDVKNAILSLENKFPLNK